MSTGIGRHEQLKKEGFALQSLPFTLMNFTPSVACGDSSLKREPRQEFELHFAASERDQYFVRLCDFKFYAKVMVFAGIKQASLTEGG